MERIELTLKNVKLRSYHVIGWILAFLNVVIQLAFTLSETYQQDRIWIIALLLVMALLLFIKRGDKFNFPDKKKSIGMIYFLSAVIWVKWHLYGFAAATLLFDVLYLFSIRKFGVVIQRDVIIYPSFPKKKIRWNELQNIIMKDGILTIDLKNNKLLQNEIEGDDDLNEQEFNEFCREQLKK